MVGGAGREKKSPKRRVCAFLDSPESSRVVCLQRDVHTTCRKLEISLTPLSPLVLCRSRPWDAFEVTWAVKDPSQIWLKGFRSPSPYFRQLLCCCGSRFQKQNLASKSLGGLLKDFPRVSCTRYMCLCMKVGFTSAAKDERQLHRSISISDLRITVRGLPRLPVN